MDQGPEQRLKDGLEQTLNRVIDWVKYEEAKNGALVTLDGVGVGVVLQWLSSPHVSVALARCLKGCLAALLLSLVVALSSFYPVLKGAWLHRCMARPRGRPHQKTEAKPNVLFFGDIAGTGAKDYLKDFRSAILGSHDFELAYAEQIVTNAEIALLKVRMFQAAFVVSFLSFLVICGAAVIYSFPK